MSEIHGKRFEPYINGDEIAERVKLLAREIRRDHPDSVPLIIAILNGAFVFASDLMRSIEGDVEITFVKVKSYEGTTSNKNARTLIGLEEDIKGRDIILLDDIIDTGHTFDKLIEDLKAMEPKSIKTCCLLFKKEAFESDFNINYVGFEIGKKFVVGYGLDYNDRGRNLDGIYILSE